MDKTSDHWKNNLDEALAILEDLEYLKEDEYGEIKSWLPEGHPNYQIVNEAIYEAKNRRLKKWLEK